ncbi:ParB N-terminal domain-containing protein [Patescibacteria group bacterium]|nr:ParB N-terminal domain-containing protein [Patescibacteria group bacterium]
MDPGYLREVKEIEIAHLQLRYAHTRIHRPERVSSLASSIERFGQIIPVIALREGRDSFVLIDGYLRVKAVRRCRRDTVVAEIWECKEEEALVKVLARAHTRKWDLIEEAALLRELYHQYHLPQSRIASLLGRKQGWVSGRLALYDALSEDILELIRKGCISTWAATRVITPIARAIPEHGKVLSESLTKEDLSTRDLALFFRHYQKANRKQRENMVLQPALFLKALRAREEATEAKGLKEGVEGKWLRELRWIAHRLRGLLKEVPTLFYSGQGNLDRRILLTALEESQGLFVELEKKIRRLDRDDHPGEPTSDRESLSAGSAHPADQPNP